MIFANVQRTWPEVLAGRQTPESSVLGDWSSLAEAKLHQYADAVAGVAGGAVVAVYDVEGWDRVGDDRVRFHGTPSARWAHLVGAPSPVVWTRGQARPIRYLDSADLAAGPASTATQAHRDRVSLRGWTLQLGRHDDAVLHVPPGGRVTIVADRASDSAPDTGPVGDSPPGRRAINSAIDGAINSAVDGVVDRSGDAR